MAHSNFLEALALLLCVAALVSMIFQRLHQPLVLGYILSGLIIGPHLPVPLIADREIVETLSEFGVILLMFSLGLEFSLRKLLHVGPSAGAVALIQCSIQLWLGFLTARAFGFSTREALFTGAALSISSTTIIAKAFEELHVARDLRSLVVAVLIVEDLIALVLMAGLTAMGQSDMLSPKTILQACAQLAAFLGVFAMLGMLVIPRLIRAAITLGRPEITLVTSLGMCFSLAYVAQRFDYSIALGAFLAGSLIAESGEQHQVERLIEPVRNMFAAIFFVSVGMSIDPHAMWTHAPAIAVLTVVVIVGKILGVSLGAFSTGSGLRLSIRAGMSLAQIGEFSFIIAGLGRTLGATRDFLYPTVAAVSVITTLTTPWLIKASEPTARFVEDKLPANVQSLVALYSSWIARLRVSSTPAQARSQVRRLGRLLALDATLLAALVIFSARYTRAAANAIAKAFSLHIDLATTLLVTLEIAGAVPLCLGISSVVRHLGSSLSQAALPEAQHTSHPELGRAARRTLTVMLQLVAWLLTGLPLLAVTQPFLHGIHGAWLLGLGLLAYAGIAFHHARAFQGEVNAGTQLIATALRQGHETQGISPELQTFLQELGEPKPVTLIPESRAVGQTLVDLNLRGTTGATVLLIARKSDSAIVPTGRERLRENDILVLAGTHQAVALARKLLITPTESAAIGLN